jgi:hypothetical protein
MKIEHIQVTPKLAGKWLYSSNSAQRTISSRRVEQYAQAMKSGHWKTSQLTAIALDRHDNIIDGQHRLAAIISAKRTIDLYVWRDCDPNDFAIVDQGMPRTGSQLAKIAQRTYAKSWHISTINSLLWNCEDTQSARHTWSAADLLYLLDFYSEQLAKVFPPGTSGLMGLRVASVRGAALRVLLNQPENADKIVDFITIVANGEVVDGLSVSPKMPIMLRNWHLKNRPKSTAERYNAYWLGVKAIEHAIDGTTIKNAADFRLKEKVVNKHPIAFDGWIEGYSAQHWLEAFDTKRAIG